MSGTSLEGISPFFIVSSVKRTVAFYRDDLGFEVRFLEPDRDPFFAIVGRDAVQILVKSDGAVAPLSNHQRHVSMRWDAYVSVADPDALAIEFTGRGVVFSQALQDTEDELRGFEVVILMGMS